MYQFEWENALPKSRIQKWEVHFAKYATLENFTAKHAQATQAVPGSAQPSGSNGWESHFTESETLSSSCYFLCISVQEIFRDTKACPYRIQTRQTLTALDKQPRKAMVDKLLDKIEKYPEFLNLLWTLDKAYFNLERKGELKERKALRESSLHSALWGIWHDGTVTKEKYVEVVKAFNSDKSHACNRAPAKVLKKRSKVTPK